MLLENSQVNLQHGRCKLTKHRYSLEPAASVPLLSVHPCALLNDKFLLSTATEGRRIEQKRCLPLQTRKSIYNMDVVNWCNLLLPNTTDILVRSELASLSPIAHEFADCKLIAAWNHCLPWQFWKCTSVCITQWQVFAQYCHGGRAYSVSELLIMHIIQCYNRPVQKRKFPNRFNMPRWRMFMRTTLDLSASLLEEAMELTNIRTKTEVITRALENLIQKEKVQQHTINNDL